MQFHISCDPVDIFPRPRADSTSRVMIARYLNQEMGTRILEHGAVAYDHIWKSHQGNNYAIYKHLFIATWNIYRPRRELL